MKLWISKNSEVAVRDQIVAQITLGIASGDLAAGERLPSTRELARRFHIHPNTVSSAYRELAAKSFVEFKKGSGVFVANGNESSSNGIRAFFDDFLSKARSAGFSFEDVQRHVQSLSDVPRTERFLVVESDEALLEILVDEVHDATRIDTKGIAPERLSKRSFAAGTQIVAMHDEETKLRGILPENVGCIFLNANSVPNSLSGNKRPLAEDLIAIISGWEKFVVFARLFLIAAKLDPDMLIARVRSDRDWKKGIDQASMIICDSLTAKKFRDKSRVRIFPLIARSSLEKLQKVGSHDS